MPQNGKAMCEMEDGVIEYGMGFNGEPGILREKLGTAQHIVETMMDMLIRDLDYKSGEKIAILLKIIDPAILFLCKSLLKSVCKE